MQCPKKNIGQQLTLERGMEKRPNEKEAEETRKYIRKNISGQSGGHMKRWVGAGN